MDHTKMVLPQKKIYVWAQCEILFNSVKSQENPSREERKYLNCEWI